MRRWYGKVPSSFDREANGCCVIMKCMKKGLFITFEGPDGSGKTTVSTAVILDPKNTEMDPRCEALLYAAARRQHLVEKVLPALEEGITIVSDRFVDSSLAYQGYGRKIGIDEVYSINMFAIEGKLPDKTIYLDIDAKTGLDRINANRASLDRLDQESEDFHNLVHAGYEAVVEKYKDRMVIVDASKSVDEVINECYSIMKGLLDD